MATAKRIELTPVPPPLKYTLELTASEATSLRSLLYFNVSGSTPARNHVLDISLALESVGVTPGPRYFDGDVVAI